MGLKLYNEDKILLSEEGMMSNPLRTHHDGKDGSADTKLIYIRNNDPVLYYEEVTLIPIDNAGYDDTIGEYGTGFNVKLSYGMIEPLPHEWNLINSGNSITVPTDIGSSSLANTTTYYPVWIRINIPGNTRVQDKSDISLRLQAIKRPIS